MVRRGRTQTILPGTNLRRKQPLHGPTNHGTVCGLRRDLLRSSVVGSNASRTGLRVRSDSVDLCPCVETPKVACCQDGALTWIREKHIRRGDNVGTQRSRVKLTRSSRSSPTMILMKNSSSTSCPRFATMHILKEGLGHRFGEVLLGMAFATEFAAQYVYPGAGFEEDGRHGRYAGATAFFGFQDLLSVQEIVKDRDLQVVNLQMWEDAFHYMDSCNVLLQLPSSHACAVVRRGKIGKSFCFLAKKSRYDALKYTLRHLHISRGHYQPSKFLYFQTDVVHVAWHVRLGDVTSIPSREFVERICSMLKAMFMRAEVQHSVFADFASADVETDLKYLPGDFVRGMSALDTLHHLIMADVLVCSGSSFSQVAAVLKSPPQVAFQVLPHEKLEIYEVSDHPTVDQKGRLLAYDAPILKSRARDLIQQKKTRDTKKH